MIQLAKEDPGVEVGTALAIQVIGLLRPVFGQMKAEHPQATGGEIAAALRPRLLEKMLGAVPPWAEDFGQVVCAALAVALDRLAAETDRAIPQSETCPAYRTGRLPDRQVRNPQSKGVHDEQEERPHDGPAGAS